MPQITEYNAPALGLRPTETGINATAAAARRVGAEYTEAAAAKQAMGQMLGSAVRVAGDIGVKYLDHQQISHGAAALAGFVDRSTKEWNEIAKNADPNDPTVGPKFMERMEGELEKFKSGFLTEGAQQWAESHVAQFRQHMVAKTSADMSTMAGHAAVINQHKTINALSATVHSDPSSLDYSLGVLDTATAAVVGSSPTMSATDAARVKSELIQRGKEAIVKSAALGHIEKTGEMPPWLEDPKYSGYVNGAELKALAQNARYYKRMEENERKSARVLEEHDARTDFHKKVNELELSLLPQNVGDPVALPADYWQKVRDLGKHPGAALEPGRVAKLVHDGEVLTNRMNKPEVLARVSRPTTVDLLNRMRATDASRLTDTSAIYDAFGEGKLSNTDFKFLINEFNNMRSPQGETLGRARTEFFKRHEFTIDAGMGPGGGRSALGSQKLYEAEMEARRQEEVLRAASKDPGSLYDPRSPDYFGKPENLQRFHVSLQDEMNYQKTLGNKPAAPAAPPAGTSAPVRPRSAAERDTLPPGTRYIAPDGSVRTRQ